jgi:hypothetical protein
VPQLRAPNIAQVEASERERPVHERELVLNLQKFLQCSMLKSVRNSMQDECVQWLEVRSAERSSPYTSAPVEPVAAL